VEGLPEERQFLHLVPHHEIWQSAAINTSITGLQQHVHADGVATETEKEGLAQG